MVKLRGRALVVAGLVLVALGAEGSASVASPPALARLTSLAGYSDVELRDLELVAKSKGISLEQAGNDIGWQNAFALFATAIEEDFPDSFAGAAIEDPAAHVASIAFSGQVPAGAATRASAFPAAAVQMVGGRAWSIRELDERLSAAHRAIADRHDLVDAVSSTYEPQTGAITVEVRPKDTSLASDALGRDALAQELRSAVPDSVRASVGEILVRADLVNTPESVVGGGRIEGAGTGDLRCSGGFTIKHSSQVTGLATAGHCFDANNTYENSNGGTEMTMNFGGGGPGGDWGDFQWHRVDGTEADDFYADAGDLRDVAAIAHPVQNQTLCRYGQAFPAACAIRLREG